MIQIPTDIVVVELWNQVYPYNISTVDVLHRSLNSFAHLLCIDSTIKKKKKKKNPNCVPCCTLR
jgi:hypothetical protein